VYDVDRIRLGRPPLKVDIEKMKELAISDNSVRAIAKGMGISKSLVHKTSKILIVLTGFYKG